MRDVEIVKTKNGLFQSVRENQNNCNPPCGESLSSSAENNEWRLSGFLFFNEKRGGVERCVTRVHLLERLRERNKKEE